MSDFYYVTKYVLSQRGILRVELDVYNGYGYTLEHCSSQYKIGTEAFFTWLEALTNCEERREKKLLSLARQTSDIAALKFEEPSK